ncbi:hypothetical protein F5Y17DRAFT_113296 [Xylariaceae sp. FL0594]|nr:hypothetical protein F5Y17DRAFT_113296 [Xylariaceae sp. FL0594]
MPVDIHKEAREGSLIPDKLTEFLKGGGDINEADPVTGFTPLAAAAKAGHPYVVNLLLQNKADVNKKSRYGCTPLYFAANARAKRAEVVRALLDNKADIDATDPLCDNETPLMVAIKQARDAKVVAMLVGAGASLKAANIQGETAQSMAEKSGDASIQRAILPPGQQRPGLAELVNSLVSLVLFVLAYVNSGVITGVVKGVVSNLYHIVGSTQPDAELSNSIENPTTVDDFKNAIDQYVTDFDLGQFFSEGNDYIQKVAEKAVALKDDPNNHLKKPEQVRGLVQLALYQPVFYCDDSGSMEATLKNSSETRMDAQRRLVTRMASIATRLVPDGHGAHLRFINKNDSGMDDLSQDKIEEKMKFVPNGGTQIGTQLRQQILKPFIYDVLDSGKTLEKPYLVLTITDGEPNSEDKGAFKDAIVECGRRLVDRQYEQEAVTFLVSQVGDDEAADEFINGLGAEKSLQRVLYRTSERLHEKYSDLRDNEQDLEEWLFNILMKPITG